MFSIVDSSSVKVPVEQIVRALSTRHRIRLRLYLKGTKLAKWVYWPVQVGFLYMDLSIVPSLCLDSKTSKKLSLLFISFSMVKFRLSWAILNIAKSAFASMCFGMTQKISSTYLLYWENVCVMGFNMPFSNLLINISARNGHRGEPIATPSICLQIALLK